MRILCARPKQIPVCSRACTNTLRGLTQSLRHRQSDYDHLARGCSRHSQGIFRPATSNTGFSAAPAVASKLAESGPFNGTGFSCSLLTEPGQEVRRTRLGRRLETGDHRKSFADTQPQIPPIECDAVRS